MSAPDEQLQVRVAWLYFMEGLTQGEIADRLGLTRLRANRLLGEARASGLVGITINSRLASCVALERRLVGDFGLKDAVILPTPDDAEQIPALLGRATGEYLSRYLEERPAKGLGVGWGATLRETIRHVKAMSLPDLTVNSMMGGLTHGSEINTFDIVADLARRVGAQCAYLAAPIYAGSPASRDTIMAQDVFRESFERVAGNDLAVLSIGDLSRRSLLIRYGLPADVNLEQLKQKGAVGDVMGTFLDARGQPIRHPINRRVIAPSIETLSKIGTVIVTSGGVNKAAILAAVLKTGLCSVLIADEASVNAALELR